MLAARVSRITSTRRTDRASLLLRAKRSTILPTRILAQMTKERLRIGIACFPLIGGSGILATALGAELARRGHEVHFFSYAQPVRLDLPQDNLHFHRVDVAHNPLFPSPDYTLPL